MTATTTTAAPVRRDAAAPTTTPAPTALRVCRACPTRTPDDLLARLHGLKDDHVLDLVVEMAPA